MEDIARFFNRYGIEIAIAILGGGGFLYWKWRTHEKIKKLARELGIVYSTTADEILGIVGKKSGSAAESYGLRTFLGILCDWRLDGKMNGVSVTVRNVREQTGGTDNREHRYTSLNALFDSPLGFGLLVTQRQLSSPGLLEKMVSKMFSSSDDHVEVSTGNQNLDEKVRIKAVSPERVRELIASADLQNQILQALEFDRSISIDDQGVHLIRGRNFNDPEKIRTVLNVVSATARSFRQD